jgi:hypothetical protein
MMKRFSQLVERIVAAELDGQADVVGLQLEAQEPRARAIYEALHGHPMPPVHAGHGPGTADEVVNRADAVRLLRTHAGNGGVLLARDLDRYVPAERTVVWLKEGFGRMFTGMKGRRYDVTVFGYESDWCHHESYRKSNSEISGVFVIEWIDGKRVPMCCDDPKYTGELRMLLELALTGKRSGTVMSDKDLADVLLSRCTPAAIAEVIRALRKLGDGKDRWLVSILGRYRRLREVARQVEHELTGG